jgi:curved DNA-binding protein CbpA
MITIPGITPLEILGLKRGASLDEVGTAFRRLSKLVHPDVFPGGDGLFRVLVAARDALADAPTNPERPEFGWYRAKPGTICCGTAEGLITVYRCSAGWRWSIPGGIVSLRAWEDPADARTSAEEAFLLKYRT